GNRGPAFQDEEGRRRGVHQAHAVPFRETANRGNGWRFQEDHGGLQGRRSQAGHAVLQQRRPPADPGQDQTVRRNGQVRGGRVRKTGEEEGNPVGDFGGRGQELPAPGGDRESPGGGGPDSG